DFSRRHGKLSRGRIFDGLGNAGSFLFGQGLCGRDGKTREGRQHCSQNDALFVFHIRYSRTILLKTTSLSKPSRWCSQMICPYFIPAASPVPALREYSRTQNREDAGPALPQPGEASDRRGPRKA